MTTKAPPTKRKLVTKPAGPVDKRRRKRGLTTIVRTAIDAMIYERCTRAEACEKAGFTERALYLALEKPEVAQYFNRAIHLLRTGERAQNVHRLAELRDQDDNRAAAVKAIQVLEQLDAEASARPPTEQRPGVTIRIIQQAPAPPPRMTIDVTPSHDRQSRGTGE